MASINQHDGVEKSNMTVLKKALKNQHNSVEEKNVSAAKNAPLPLGKNKNKKGVKQSEMVH
jgi:hypothetical protein